MKLAKALEIEDELDRIITLKPNAKNASSSKIPFPVPCSIRTCLTHYLDLRPAIKQHHLELFAKYSGDPSEKAVLLQLADLRELFNEAIVKPQKVLSDILNEFPSIKVFFLDLYFLSIIFCRFHLRLY